MARSALATIIVVALVLVACERSDTGDPAAAVIERVVDGDTVDVRIGGRVERVRLIGIDTPEVAHPAAGDRPANAAECFGEEARRFVQRVLPPGTEVRLERDIVPRDDYGRLLAYVRLAADGTLLNLSLVEAGLATPLTIDPNVAHVSEIVDASRRAEAAGLGLWGACRSSPSR